MNEPLLRPKKLIVTCDGTWMNSDSGWVKEGIFDNGHLQTPSNVTRIARAILPENDQKQPQIVYYQAGLGTGFSTVVRMLGGDFGQGMSENIREAYSFLVTNYLDGDEIFLLGFSRGAYTARSVGGMISSIGLLTKDAMDDFYDIFSDYENAGVANYTPRYPIADSNFCLKTDPAD
ncbi:hypothetical protein LTS18_003373, partial [Coniosporium uncinatum]